ncbi:Splicing factor U2af small subunit B [Acorus gramineus]|uniref:Splicing factor U2af small subunit B n=1 Tax=Acorus gramineus TaxID=55184 RepID=A0AAV9A4A8_ACOGR|nr:Splicing factor U2af small subunit B [Acorus gramineus]
MWTGFGPGLKMMDRSLNHGGSEKGFGYEDLMSGLCWKDESERILEVMAEHLASILGTEKDRVNCPFYFKIGACRHGDRCSRLHNRPTISPTLLLSNMYQRPDSITPVREEDQAAAAIRALQGRFYSGRPIIVDFSPVTDFREATCRRFEENSCNRGGYCNFMYVKQIGRDLRRKLFGSLHRSRPSRSRRRSVSPSQRRDYDRRGGDYRDHRDHHRGDHQGGSGGRRGGEGRHGRYENDGGRGRYGSPRRARSPVREVGYNKMVLFVIHNLGFVDLRSETYDYPIFSADQEIMVQSELKRQASGNVTRGNAGYVMPMPNMSREGEWIIYIHMSNRHLDVDHEATQFFRPLMLEYLRL